MKRCAWPANNELMIEYHDKEWGTPLHDDGKFFEFLVLDSFQAGLSWNTILNKRKNFEKAFHGFNVKKISKYKEKDFKRLMADTGIVRNRLKIKATTQNAKVFLKIQKEFGSFDKYIWDFVNNKPIQNSFKKMGDLPAKTPVSDVLSKDLKNRGMNFVGPTIIYAFMQGAGLVNDHTVDCFRYKEVRRKK